MGRLRCSSFLPYLAVLFLSVLANSCSAESVSINDGESLMKYLCSPTGTLPPNTNLELNKDSFTIDGKHSYCLIENTTNITIAPSQELLKNGKDHVRVECLPGSEGFAFFNVSNLTISSIVFDNCAGIIPARAVSYADGFISYNNAKTAFIFNHCYNLTLNNLIPNTSEFSIIGVNPCGHSRVHINVASITVPYMRTLFYYTDSFMTSSSSNCNLHIENNSTLEMPLVAEPMKQSIEKLGDHLEISKITGWFTLILSQQIFGAIVNLNMTPTCSSPIWTGPKQVISVLFIGMTDSQVIFQGVLYEYCSNASTSFQDPKHYFIPLPLRIMYNSTLTNKIVTGVSSIIIKNTAFPLYTHTVPLTQNTSYIKRLLEIWSYSYIAPHNITLENTSWCLKHLGSNSNNLNKRGKYLMIVGGLIEDKVRQTVKPLFYIDIINAYMHYTDPPVWGLHPLYMIYFGNAVITFNGNNQFFANHKSILQIAFSNVTFSGNLTMCGSGESSATFKHQGAAMIITKKSNLIFKEPLEARFYDNRAIHGSAIYLTLAEDCTMYIQPNRFYSLENISLIEIAFYFRNNTNYFNAPNSLFIHEPFSTLHLKSPAPKFLFEPHDWDSRRTQFAYSTVFDVILKEMDKLDKFTSLPNGICWQLHGMKWDCTYVDYLHSSNDLILLTHHTYPGEKAIFISYPFGNVINAWQVSCSDNQLAIRDLDHLLHEYDRNLTISATFQNQEEEEICVLMRCIKMYSDPNAIIFYIKVNAYCPLGFNKSKEGYCNCTQALHSRGYKCDIETRIITSSSNHWTGYNNDSSNETVLFTSNCPPNYCDPNFHNFVLNDSITDLSCLNSRTGILCGQCKENYSAVFGSEACYDNCTDLYLLTLPMYALAGLVLVVLLFALRLTVATGTINGVIFYANLLGLSMDKLTEDYRGPYATFLRIAISLLNLDLNFPLCFYKEMTPEAKIGFQFIFPVYLWSIVIGMIILSKRSIKLSNLISTSSVQVLSTLLYFSYSKLLRTVIDIVSYTQLYSITDHSDTENSKRVWFFNGEDYGHGVHSFYLALAAIFTAFFLLPYTVLLTFSSSLMKFRLFNKVFKPFGDAYGGPFKDKWRFWFGLRLWITLLLFATNGALQGKYTEIMLTIHRMIIILFILIQACCRPFKNCMIGLVDLLFMLDYWLIIACYIFFGSTSLATYILVSLALIMLLVILLFHIGFDYLKTPNLISKIRNKYGNRHEILDDKDDRASEESDRELFIAAKEREDEIIDTY